MATTRPKVLVVRNDIPDYILEPLRAKCEVDVYEKDGPMPRAEYERRLAGKDAVYIIGGSGWLDQAAIDAAGPQLKVAGTMSVGYDHIDVPLCKSLGIKVGNTPDVLSPSVAEVAIFLTLMVLRRVKEMMATITEDTWKNNPGAMFHALGHSLEGKTVGIVGLGGIGKTIAKCVKPFAVKNVVYYSRTRKPEAEKDIGIEYAAFDDVVTSADVVMVCCPLTAETKHSFNKAVFQKMKKSAIVVNISRGPVIQQDDLIEALQSGEIAGAGLDVMTPEPLPPSHVLANLPNVVLSPHMGSATVEARNAMGRLTVANILAGLEGAPMPAPLC